MLAIKPSKSVSFSLALLSTLLLGSCATRHQPFIKDQEEANPYLKRAQTEQNKKLALKLAENSYRMLRGSNPVFAAEVKKELNQNAWLSTLPEGWIHADAHVLQPVRLNKSWGWSDWDTFTEGWFWFDLLHAEVSARSFHKSGGFRSNYNYSCYDSYVESFLRKPPAQPSFDKEALATFVYNTQEDFSQHGAWTGSAQLSEVNKSIVQSFLLNNRVKTEIDTALHRKLSSAPVRELESGIGSFNQAKFLFLSNDKQLYELKEVCTPPANKLKHEGLNEVDCETPENACARYTALSEKFGDASFLRGLPLACFAHEGRTFTLLKWTLDYASYGVKDFTSWNAAKSFIEWSCGSLAQFHKHGMSEVQQRKWALSLASPAPLQIQIKKLSKKLFERLDEGHRMWALEQNIE